MNNYQEQANFQKLSSFDLQASENRRFGYQMAALGFAVVGAGLILSPMVAVVAGAAVSGVAAISLVSAGIMSLVFGGGFSVAKSGEQKKQQQHVTLMAASQSQPLQVEHHMQPERMMEVQQWQSKLSTQNTDKTFQEKESDKQRNSVPQPSL